MKKLKDYTIEELLLIYFNQSNAPRAQKLVTPFGTFNITYGDAMYSDYNYYDDNYSDSDSIDRYSNSSYSNSDYSDSSYGDSLYSEYDAYSGPGGRFYTEYDEYVSTYDDYFDYEYTDVGYDNYSDSGYSYSDYAYRQSNKPSRRAYTKDPLHSFWFVIACLALLMIPILIFGIALSYNEETTKVAGGWIALSIYASLPFLAIGLPIFIPKMFSHARYIDYEGYDRDPLKSFSFVATFLILFLGVILALTGVENIVNPRPATDPNHLEPFQLTALFVSSGIYIVIGLFMLIYKIKKHKDYKYETYSNNDEEAETATEDIEEFIISKIIEEYVGKAEDMPNAGIGNRVMLKSLKTNIETDYAFNDFFTYENKNYLRLEKNDSEYDYFEVDIPNNKFYLVKDTALKVSLATVALERAKARLKELMDKNK